MVRTRLLRLRYEYIGQLDPIARKVVGGRKLTWIQELRLDTATYTGTLDVLRRGRARAGSTATAERRRSPRSPATTGARRHIAGDLHVRIPVVGGTAEKRIVPGLVRRLDVEAAALTRELAAPG